jgi:hypothetical protein
MKYFTVTFPDGTIYVGLSLSNSSVKRNIITLKNNAGNVNNNAYNSLISQKTRSYGTIQDEWVFVSPNYPKARATAKATKIMQSAKDSGKSLNKFEHLKMPQYMSATTKNRISQANKGANSYLYGKYGAEHPKSFQVVQYKLNDKGQIMFEKHWDSITLATDTLGINNISAVIYGKQKTAGGYFWMEVEKYVEYKKGLQNANK